MTPATNRANVHDTDAPPRWLLVVFIALCLVYLVVTPPFEASDELWHFGMIQHIAATGQLPVQAPGVETAWEQEGSQPPLYYLIGALIALPFDRSDFDETRQPNPHVKAGVPGDTDNKNLVLRDAYPVPPQGTALAVYAVRLFSIACAVVTVAAVYRAARLLVPQARQVAILAAGLTAFNPMFLFISASVNNDNLVTALNALVILQMLIVFRQDRLTLQRSLALSLLFTLASLTKLSALVLVPFLGLGIAWVCFRRRDWRACIRFAVLIVAAWAIIAAWWYVRNMQLYGEFFGTRTMVAVAGAREAPFSAQTLLNEFEGFRISYWGLFGAVNVLAPQPFYWLMDGITLLSVIGLVMAVNRATPTERGLLFYLGGMLLTGFAAVVAWTAQTYASQGRLLFPFMAAASPLMAFGLWMLLRQVSRVIVAALAVVALVLPLIAIVPAYALPAPQAAVAPTARPVFAQFDDIRLIGYETDLRRYTPGESLAVTLYWQPQAASERPLSLYLHAVDSRGEVLGRIDTYPGGGRLRTTTWTAGMIYADSYQVRLETAPAEPTNLRLQIGWWHAPTESVITAVDAEGTALDSVMLDAGAVYTTPALPQEAVDVDAVAFGGAFVLTGYRLDGDRLTLVWRTQAAAPVDYVVFAQVLNAAGDLVGQGDAPPAISTQYLNSGDTFVTTHELRYGEPLAPGTYTCIIGWYSASDFARLSTPFADNAYPLLTIER